MEQNHIIKISDEDIIECYNKGKSLNSTAAELQMATVTLWRRANKLGLKWKNIKRKSVNKIPLNDIIEGNHPEYQTFKLKKRLINEGLKFNICEICEISEWNGNILSMQLDHIDGNPHNHLLNNLRMICPNCHSQTETYCGKNKK
jgi:hypothetical protein